MSDPLIGPQPGGTRLLDRVLAENYLVGLDAIPLEEVRTRRREAQQEEADLSFVRRLLQGRIDIVRAELSRRGTDQGGSVVEQLPTILADRRGRSSARHLTVGPSGDGHRRDVERLLADVEISDVTARTDTELWDAHELLVGHERRVSEFRLAVQRVIDTCSAEIARRYRDGEARVEDLLRDPSG